MMDDLKTVIWKEWRETQLQHGSTRRWLLSILMYIGLLGIVLPLQLGRVMVESLFMLMWMWMPMLTSITQIADAIAGERERHTLETLLASRLPDQSIVLGKIVVIIVQSWVVMLAGAVLALVTVNVVHREGAELIMYPTPTVFGILVLPPLLGMLVTGIGVLASMHAATVRQAYQRLAIPLVAMIMIPSLGLSLLPRDFLARFYSPEFAQNNLGNFLVVFSLALLVLDAAILAAALSRFRRGHLITD